MHDTEPMPAVVPRSTRPAASPAFFASAAGLTSLCALAACLYLHAEVVGLRSELHATRVAAQQAERAADRASAAAESARSSVANVEPTDAPDPTDLPDGGSGDASR